MASNHLQEVQDLFSGRSSSIPRESLNEFRKMLIGMARRIEGSLQQSDLDDIVQEASIKLMVMVRENKIRTSFVGAAFYAVRSAVHKRFKDQFLDELSDEEPHPTNLQELIEHQENIRELQHAVSTLEQDEQDLLYERYVLGRRMNVIAADKGVPANTMTTRHKRILTKLKNKLEGKITL